MKLNYRNLFLAAVLSLSIVVSGAITADQMCHANADSSATGYETANDLEDIHRG